MADAAAAFRQQRANRLLTLCAIGKYADAAFECCSPTMSPVCISELIKTERSHDLGPSDCLTPLLSAYLTTTY